MQNNLLTVAKLRNDARRAPCRAECIATGVIFAAGFIVAVITLFSI